MQTIGVPSGAIGVKMQTIGTKFCARDALSTAIGGGGLAVGMGTLFGEALEAGQHKWVEQYVVCYGKSTLCSILQLVSCWV